MKFKSLIGMEFGFLEVLEEDAKKCLCRCKACGNTSMVTRSNLTSGHTKSCGCIKKKACSENFKKHGQTGTRLHNIWRDILKRCKNKNYREFHLYGGRGIEVCEEWTQFENFFNWAKSNGYEDSLTIDRVDTNGNYEPSNCRWTTQKRQNNNKRNNHFITFRGRTLTISEWSDATGISQRALWYRISHGWTIEKALTHPIRRKEK